MNYIRIPIIEYLSPKAAYAQCYNWDEPQLGAYLSCALPNVFDAIQWIFIAVAIVLTLWMVFQTVTRWDEPGFIQSMYIRWFYLFIFVLLVATRGGLIFIPLRWLGFGDESDWIGFLNDFIGQIDQAATPGSGGLLQ